MVNFAHYSLTHETFFMQVSTISNADGSLEKVEPVKLPNGASVEEFQVVILFFEYLKVKIIVWSTFLFAFIAGW